MRAMRLLLPTDVPFDTDPLGDEALARVYRYPAATGDTGSDGGERTWLRANFVATLDGAATGPDGRSGSINTHADRLVFALLRALSDVIVVGAGTARAEGYRPPVASARWRWVREQAGQTAQPAMLVVTRSGDVPPLLAEEREQAGDVLLLTSRSAPPAAVDLARRSLGEERVLVCGDDRVDFHVARKELAARGWHRLLCEGGPHLMHDLASQGALDELCLTITPSVVAGEHPRILAGPELWTDLVPHTLIEADGSLIGRWVRPNVL
jgi:riboflavin biosynthesis pyrimidine reductase